MQPLASSGKGWTNIYAKHTPPPIEVHRYCCESDWDAKTTACQWQEVTSNTKTMAKKQINMLKTA